MENIIKNGKGETLSFHETKHQKDEETIETLSEQLVDIATINNHSVAYVYNADGSVQSTTEKDAANNTIKTVTYTYNVSGDVVTSVTVMNGKTVTTTYNYDGNGNISGTSNVVS